MRNERTKTFNLTKNKTTSSQDVHTHARFVFSAPLFKQKKTIACPSDFAEGPPSEGFENKKGEAIFSKNM